MHYNDRTRIKFGKSWEAGAISRSGAILNTNLLKDNHQLS